MANPAKVALLFLRALATIAMLDAAPAAASEGLKMPSNNIVCILEDTDGAAAALRCDVANLTTTRLRAPKDCHLGWGDAFEIGADGKSGARICHGDTIMHEDVSVAPYGTTWQHGGFTCRSLPSGLTCTNATGHGFSQSRSAQRMF